MIGPNRNPRGRQVVGTVLAPRTSRPSMGQIDDIWKGLLIGTAPTFGSATISGSGWTISVSNYDTLTDYTVSTTAGSVSFASGTVTQSGLGYSTSATVTVTASKTGYTTVQASNTQTTSSAPTPPPPPPPPPDPCAGYVCVGCNAGNYLSAPCTYKGQILSCDAFAFGCPYGGWFNTYGDANCGCPATFANFAYCAGIAEGC